MTAVIDLTLETQEDVELKLAPAKQARLDVAQIWSKPQEFPDDSIAMVKIIGLGAAFTSVVQSLSANLNAEVEGLNQNLNTHVESTDPHPNYALDTDLTAYGKKDTAQTWTQPQTIAQIGAGIAPDTVHPLRVGVLAGRSARFDGGIAVGTDALTRASLFVVGNQAASSIVAIRGATSQAGDFQQWQDSAGTKVAGVDAYGSIQGHRLYAGPQTTSARLNVITDGAAGVGAIIRGSASQTGNLMEFQRQSDGYAFAFVTAGGRIYTDSQVNALGGGNFRNSSGHIQSGSMLSVEGSSTTAATAIVRAMASQTGDMQQWQHSNGTVYTRIASDGSILTNEQIRAGSGLMAGPLGNFTSGAALDVSARLADRTTVAVRAIVSQTGDLQQWQDSSGNVKAKLAADGHLHAYRGYIGPVSGSHGVTFGVKGHASGSAAFIVERNGSTEPSFRIFENGGTTLVAVPATALAASQNTPSLGWTHREWLTGATAETQYTWSIATGAYGGGSGAHRWALAAPDGNYPLAVSSIGGSVAIGGGQTFPSSTSPALTVRGIDPARVGLLVRGATAAQSVDLQQWTTDTGAVWAAINHIGRTYLGNALAASGSRPNGGLNVSPYQLSDVVIRARGLAGQTGDLFSAEDSAGTVLARINSTGTVRAYGFSAGVANAPSDGQMRLGGGTPSLYFDRVKSEETSPTQEWLLYDTGGSLFVRDVVNAKMVSQFSAGPAGDAQVLVHDRLVVRKGSAIQTNDLFVVQNEAQAAMARISVSGELFVGSIRGQTAAGGSGIDIVGQSNGSVRLMPNGTGTVQALAAAPGSVALIARAAAVQTASIQEWQDPAGTVLSRISNLGRFVGTPAGQTPLGGTTVEAHTAATGSVAIAAVGIAGQTGDLFQAKDSAGTNLARIDSTGVVHTGGVRSTGTTLNLNSTTASLQMNTTGANVDLNVLSGTLRLYSGTGPISIRTGAVVGNEQGVATVALVTKGVFGQTADLQQWQNSAGAVLSKIDSAGRLGISDVLIERIVTGGQTQLYVDRGLRVGLNAAFQSSATFGSTYDLADARLTSISTATKPALTARSLAGASSDIQRWENSAGTVLAKVTLGGDMDFPLSSQGPVVTSPDGLTRRRIGIDNAGNLTLVAA